jgi:hypothetical protein
MALLALTLFAVWFGFWYAKHDYKTITTGYIVNHSKGLIIRIAVLLASSVLASFWSFGVSDLLLSALSILLYLVFSGVIFWVVFEMRFNSLFIDSNLFYVGRTSTQDKFLRKHKISGEMFFVFKIFVIVSTFSAILLVKFITSHLKYLVCQLLNN